MLQGYIYHLCFTPITPAQLTRLNISRLSSNPEERWRYARINQIGSYWFNQELDDVEIAKTCSLRHQVRDNECIWYDLYERNGDWFVLRHPETR